MICARGLRRTTVNGQQPLRTNGPDKAGAQHAPKEVAPVKNLTNTPVMDNPCRALVCDLATSALGAPAAQGTAVRLAPNAGWLKGEAVSTYAPAAAPAKRERAFAGKGHRAITATVATGSPAWSPPI